MSKNTLKISIEYPSYKKAKELVDTYELEREGLQRIRRKARALNFYNEDVKTRDEFNRAQVEDVKVCLDKELKGYRRDIELSMGSLPEIEFLESYYTTSLEEIREDLVLVRRQRIEYRSKAC